MARFLLLLLALLAFAAPARADDISVAGRSVVRVVVIAFARTARWPASAMAAASRSRRTGSSPTPMSSRRRRTRARPSRSASSRPKGAQATRARIVAIDPARDLALLEIEQGIADPDPALCRPARRRRAGRGSGLSRQCRSRHRALGRRLYHAAAADPLGRHLLQRPPDQRHHHPPPHRQHRPRP